MTDHSTEKRFRIGALLSVPLPLRLPELVGALAREYREIIENSEVNDLQQVRPAMLLDEIDQLILDAYDLPPKLIRALLAAFSSSERPVAHSWRPWDVTETEPALNLSELRKGVLDHARGDWVQRELSPVSGDEAARAAPYLP